MKRVLLVMSAVALLALMIGSAYAVPRVPEPTVPTPDFCQPFCSPGFTPGFWKHNIEVRLDLTNGAYSAFVGAPSDGVKLTDEMMDDLLAAINLAYPGLNLTFEQALAYLELPGWSLDRTNTANLFNEAAGYGPY